MTSPADVAEGAARPTLGRVFDPRHNSLGFLRFLLAAMVLLTHSFPLGGFSGGRDPMFGWTRGQDHFGGIAVGGFFVISGFLITRSLASAPSLPNYLWRRFLRVFPGFWVCLLVTAFVLGPLGWYLERDTVAGYLSADPSAVDYVRRNFWLTINQYNIGDLLADTPYGRTGALAFNGSLWTLIYEVKMYLALGLLGLVGVVRRARPVVLVLLAGIWLVQLAEVLSPGGAGRVATVFADLQLVRLSLAFLLGAAMFLYRDVVVMSRRGAVLAVVALVASVRLDVYMVVGVVALAYLWFWLAVYLPLQRFADRGDFSYGLYIYAFPVQQLFAVLGVHRHGLVPYFALCLAVTLVLAVASWFLVERPFLDLKDARPLHRVRTLLDGRHGRSDGAAEGTARDDASGEHAGADGEAAGRRRTPARTGGAGPPDSASS